MFFFINDTSKNILINLYLAATRWCCSLLWRRRTWRWCRLDLHSFNAIVSFYVCIKKLRCFAVGVRFFHNNKLGGTMINSHFPLAHFCVCVHIESHLMYNVEPKWWCNSLMQLYVVYTMWLNGLNTQPILLHIIPIPSVHLRQLLQWKKQSV